MLLRFFLVRAVTLLTAVAAIESSKPSVLIISGACHTPAHFRPLQVLLEHSGYAVHSPRLPSNSLLPPEDSVQQDLHLIRSTAQQLADEGKEVIALMHSYGGFLGTEALAGLGVTERARMGLTGGVKWLAYMTALLPVKGESIAETEMVGVELPLNTTGGGAAYVEVRGRQL
ncbi:uncharacterized protein ASPWEDRAFT_31563 [Neofusicoccum parvum]|uniref:Uncharacterized protein ASPWEDRAFT_31563 n=1 Tax=Neofusicoccum parvum TaxID=310453 RepID=A0ACB5SCW1_9PEZI|nr:uncharacterized protein ASPWEDRAFT_31563 [Neofusicoccum parvum]